MIRIDAVWLAVSPLDMRAGPDSVLARVVQVFGAARVKVDVAHFMQPIAVFRDATGFLRPRHRAQG